MQDDLPIKAMINKSFLIPYKRKEEKLKQQFAIFMIVMMIEKHYINKVSTVDNRLAYSIYSERKSSPILENLTKSKEMMNNCLFP